MSVDDLRRKKRKLEPSDESSSEMNSEDHDLGQVALDEDGRLVVEGMHLLDTDFRSFPSAFEALNNDKSLLNQVISDCAAVFNCTSQESEEEKYRWPRLSHPISPTLSQHRGNIFHSSKR